MPRDTRLPEPKIVESVVEWRYPKAHRYWDDCGKLTAAIEAEFSGLLCDKLEADGFSFVGSSGAISAAKFYWDRANITGQPDNAFGETAARFWAVVRNGLSINTVTRLGHRSWTLFEVDLKQAIRWLESLKIWQFPSDAGDLLGTPLAPGIVLRTRLEPGGRRMRMEVNAGTLAKSARIRGGEPQSGLIVDTDLVLEHPDVVPLEPKQFVEDNQRFLREHVNAFFRGNS